MTEETVSMKLTWYGHSAFRIEAGAAKILIDPFLSDNPSWHKGSSRLNPHELEANDVRVIFTP